MQTVLRSTDSFPGVYRNRPHSLAFNAPRPDPPCDVIYLVHPDPQLCHEIAQYFSALGIKVSTFTSATEYLQKTGIDTAACLVLNTHLPDSSGFDLQAQLTVKSNPPVIFISDHTDIPCTVRAMKAGAIEFLTLPIDHNALLAAVELAFAQDRKRRRRQAELADLQAKFALLTPREREVLPLVVGGLLNKQAASLLGISEVTLQIHRSQVMRKTQAESFADLVRMAMKLHIPHWRGCQPSRNVERMPAIPTLLQRDHGLLASSATQ